VLVLEKDQLALAPDVESAAVSALRSSAPQIVQPHIIMGRCRELLLARLPDVYEQLICAGVVEAPLSSQVPPTLRGFTPQPADERVTMLMTRRSTFDWVLQRALVAEPHVTLRCGVEVKGLVARPGSPPHITAVRTDTVDLRTDLVIDAAGRRSPLDRWLTQLGSRPSLSSWAECGLAYFSRHYRFRDEAMLPAPRTTRTVVPLDEFTVGIWGADNNAMQLAIAPLAQDHRFKTVRHPAAFTAVLRTLPSYARWLDALEPISDVFPMGGVHNTMRRLVANGVPIVTALVAIGDSVCTTNPTLGRGLTLALSGAVDVLETLCRHGDDWIGQALAMDAAVAEHVLPFYEDQAAIDAARLALLRQAIFGTPIPQKAPDRSDRVTFAQLRVAALFDATALRAFWSVMGMLRRPDDVYNDPGIVAPTHEVLRECGNAPGIVQPSREQLLAALNTPG